MKHGALFAGLNVFGLAFEKLGVPTSWCSDIDPFCQRLLLQNFPGSSLFGDIRKIKTLPAVEIVSGGFPCQDISVAGKGEGLSGARSSLWFEMLRLCGDIKPNYIIIENSPLLIKRGFEKILQSLTEIGYDAQWCTIRASDFGFPHKRERLFVVAYPNCIGQYQEEAKINVFSQKICQASGRELGRAIGREIRDKNHSGVLRDDDGAPFVVDRIKALGNAIVYDVAFYVASCVLDFDNKIKLYVANRYS